MKKIILGAIATAVLVNCSFGQGEIQFFNSSSATSKIFLSATPGGQSIGQSGATLPGAATTLYTFALFVGTSLNSGPGLPNATDSTTPFSSASWVSTGDYATNSALAGRITGVDGGLGYEVVPGPGYAAGSYANVELIGWNTAVGGSSISTFETAYAAALADGDSNGLVYGYSGVANVQLGDNGATFANSSPFGTTAGGLITGFTLAPIAPVPEPGTMALAGLGGLAMLAFRRKK